MESIFELWDGLFLHAFAKQRLQLVDITGGGLGRGKRVFATQNLDGRFQNDGKVLSQPSIQSALLFPTLASVFEACLARRTFFG
ncbi:MAG: hypothetical protein BGO13_01440 [Burkholderiales bacterium 66-5]|nr:MAG: hypothetical protein BGO13_01440 [Burkholderiales bacterium 66-5]